MRSSRVADALLPRLRHPAAPSPDWGLAHLRGSYGMINGGAWWDGCCTTRFAIAFAGGRGQPGRRCHPWGVRDVTIEAPNPPHVSEPAVSDGMAGARRAWAVENLDLAYRVAWAADRQGVALRQLPDRPRRILRNWSGEFRLRQIDGGPLASRALSAAPTGVSATGASLVDGQDLMSPSRRTRRSGRLRANYPFRWSIRIPRPRPSTRRCWVGAPDGGGLRAQRARPNRESLDRAARDAEACPDWPIPSVCSSAIRTSSPAACSRRVAIAMALLDRPESC